MLRSMQLKTLNPHITCVLCGGYLVDATTIIECLHSFCRSCIIRWLERSYKCPVCETEIHKTRPFLNIRPDRVLQDIVYKLVPGFYHNELSRRKDFDFDIEKLERERRGEEGENEDETNEEQIKEKKADDLIDDPVCITLEYYGLKRNWKEKMVFPTRYLRCSSKLPVSMLKKFVTIKFGIPDSHSVEIVRSDEIISDHLVMKDLWRIYGLHTKSYIDLQYIIIDKVLDSQLVLEEPKFKKLKKTRRRRRKTLVTTSNDPSLPSPVKRRRRRRNWRTATKHAGTSLSNARVPSTELGQNVRQEALQGEALPSILKEEDGKDPLVKILPSTKMEGILERTLVDKLSSIITSQNVDQSVDNSLPGSAAQSTISSHTVSYARPATPESETDHHGYGLNAVPIDTKPIEIHKLNNRG